MAPIGEAYFPPLDRCLSGKHQLLSWEDVYSTLLRQCEDHEHTSLRSFLSDPQTRDLLGNSFAPYSSPSAKTKSTFDTKTSAIHVTPSAQGLYNTKEIQEDSLWLSKTVNIDEIAALRVVVIEWQTRSTARLLRDSPGRNATNPVQSMVADGRYSKIGNATGAGGRDSPFHKDSSKRRLSLLEIYLSERMYLLKTSEYILSDQLDSRARDEQGKDSSRRSARPEWLEETGQNLLSAWDLDKHRKDKVKGKGFFSVILHGLHDRVQRASRECPWDLPDNISDDIEPLWTTNQVLEMVHILQIAVSLLQASKTSMDFETVVAWFRLMGDTAFFESLSERLDNSAESFIFPLQSLTVLASLSMLDIVPTLEILAEASRLGALASDHPDATQYVLDTTAVSEINDIIIACAPLKVPSPVTLAWSIISQTVRELAFTAKETKETRQSLRAADRYGTADSSDTDVGERTVTRGGPSLNRRSSASSDTSLQMTLVEEIFDAISLTVIEDDPINYLALSAVKNDNVFDVIDTIACNFCTYYGFEHDGSPGARMRLILLDLIQPSLDFLQYQPALLGATMTVLTGSQRFWDLLDRPARIQDSLPTARFIRDPQLRFKFLLRAASRFPYESLPFLQMSRALGFQYTNSSGEPTLPWMNLEELDIFTCKLPESFISLEPIREDEEGDYTRLTESLAINVCSEETDLLSTTKSVSSMVGKPQSGSRVIIPAGTTGVIQSESKPFVVGWNHTYPGLGYMGKILQTFLATNHSMSDVVVVEVLHLLSILLVSAKKDPWSENDNYKTLDSVQSVLGQASDELDSDQDVISIIFAILESQLYHVQQVPVNEASLEILTRATQFMYALLDPLPERVWPFLGRSGLLGIGQDEPQFSYVVSQEMSTGHYNFLLACVRLFEGLIEDALSHSISRRAPPKALVRFGSPPESFASGISPSTMQQVLLHFTRCMVDVLESTMNWKFSVPGHRMEINARLCATFQKILSYCYGSDDSPDNADKLTIPLLPAAEFLVNIFLPATSNDFIIRPVLNILSVATVTRQSSLPTLEDRYIFDQTVSALELVTTLLQVNVYLRKETSQLETELFKITSILAKIYAVSQVYRFPTVNLFIAMLNSAGRSSGQPPSLLGHMGQEESNHFLDLLARPDQPVKSQSLSVAIWKLFSAIVSQRQQWFSMYILTGSTPRESLQKKNQDAANESGSRGEPIINSALESLCDLENLDPNQALAMLVFVAQAASFWPLVFSTIGKYPQFLKTLAEFAARSLSPRYPDSGQDSGNTSEILSTQMLAQTATILALYTDYAYRNESQKFARGLVPHLNFFIKNAITAPDYNHSLHSNLRHNLHDKFSGCSLSSFKRTQLRTSAVGSSFYYDLELAAKILSVDPAWLGRRGQGFAEEFKRANLNLSLVEAQIELFSGWRSLLVELAEPLASEPKFQKVLALAVTDCLQTNGNNTLPQPIFKRLMHSRADLAFTLLQKLVEVKSDENEAKAILKTAWSLTSRHNKILESALQEEAAEYYRLLYRILYLALQLHVATKNPHHGSDGNHNQTNSPSIVSTVYEILSEGVAQRFRSLTVLVHSSPHLVKIPDFSLTTAMLSSCLQVTGLERESSRLLAAFSDSRTAQCAATLLSWSDQLAASTSNDPVFGEIALDFLVELSSETALAESLAVEGILSQVLSTNVIRVLQSKPYGPLDQPGRMFTMWARGFLPLALNLLNAIGPPIASEVTTALNLFPHQLAQASNAFASGARSLSLPRGCITLSMAIEAHTLALIVSVLKSFREAGASAAVSANEIGELNWNFAQVTEDIEGWLQNRDSLREKIVATDKKEEGWSRRKPTDPNALSMSVLEEKIVDELKGVVGVFTGPDEG